MITSSILLGLYLLLLLITAPIRIFNDVQPNASLQASIDSSNGLLASLNSVLPLDTLVIILGLFLAYELVLGVYKIIMWVIKKIPTIN